MSDPADDADLTAAALIELYFDLDEPGERDAVIEQLGAIDVPVVTDFFRTMLEADEDEVARAVAAQHLAARGDAAAITWLEQLLEEPEDIALFEHALQSLASVRGAAFYETLLSVWRDAEREQEQRHAAMVEMERLETGRAMQDFVAWIDAVTDFEALNDADLELIIVAFVRQAHLAGLDALARLRDRAQRAPELDEDERAEVVGMIDEGIALLRE